MKLMFKDIWIIVFFIVTDERVLEWNIAINN